MAEFDKDLLSIQEARTLATQAREAQRQFLHATQAEVDRICAAMAQAAAEAAVRLGKMATEETGYGVPEHKTLKNLLSSQILWEAIKDIPTVGVIRNDPAKRTYDIAWPMGVVAALDAFDQSHLNDHVQDFDRGQGEECDRHRAASVRGEMLRGDHPYHGGSGGAGRDAQGTHLLYDVCDFARNPGIDET